MIALSVVLKTRKAGASPVLDAIVPHSYIRHKTQSVKSRDNNIHEDVEQKPRSEGNASQ
jgi:hypothetical protein